MDFEIENAEEWDKAPATRTELKTQTEPAPQTNQPSHAAPYRSSVLPSVSRGRFPAPRVSPAPGRGASHPNTSVARAVGRPSQASRANVGRVSDGRVSAVNNRSRVTTSSGGIRQSQLGRNRAQSPRANTGLSSTSKFTVQGSNTGRDTTKPSFTHDIRGRASDVRLRAQRGGFRANASSSRPDPVATSKAHHTTKGAPQSPVKRTTARERYPRVMPLNDPLAQKKEEQEALETEVDQQLGLLRQRPTEKFFSTTGVYLWPTEELGPEILGPNYKDLDKTRLSCTSHITYEQNMVAFQVSSEDYCDAQKALKAIDNALCERIVQMTPPLKVYLTRPEWDGLQCPVVEMVDAEGSGAASLNPGEFQKVVQLKPSKSNEDERDWGTVQRKLSMTNARVLEVAVQDFFSKLVYHRGFLRLKAKIGIFVFNRYRWPKDTSQQPMTRFLEGIREFSTQGSLHKCTTDAQLLPKAVRSKGLLEAPDGSEVAPESIRPHYKGIFGFVSSAGSTSVDLELHIDASSTGMINGRSWRAVENTKGNPSLEIFMTATRRTAFSWSLEIITRPAAKGIGITRGFDREVYMLPRTTDSTSLDASELMFNFPRQKPWTFEQQTIRRFRLRANSEFFLEVVRCDRFDLRLKPDSPDARKPTGTKWHATVYHEAWDDMLSRNYSLETGQSANWGPSTDELFPPPATEAGSKSRDGLASFTRLLDDVVRTLSSVRP